MSYVDLLFLAPLGALLAIGFAILFAVYVLKQPQGSSDMIKVANAIREGAWAYLRQQYKVVILFFLAMFSLLLFLSFRGYVPRAVPFAFLTGGFFSGLTGFVGMVVATNANSRCTEAARRSLNSGLRVAFFSGAVMGLSVVGLGLLDLCIWYYLLNNWLYVHVAEADRIQVITSTMLNFGMGASSMALFARVGGGIFTKAADVGSDIVGKVEAGIPEDDPRNPATIADNVGDNVGDVAGMGADLYESYVGSIVATMALAVAAGLGLKGVTVPMVLAAVGVIASIIGIFLVRSGEKAEQTVLLAALRKGIFTSGILIAVVSYFVVIAVLGKEHLGVYWSILAGLIAGIIIGLSTEYYTSSSYSPAKSIASAAQTGAATVIISGMGIGMLSTAVPVIVVVAAILISFYLSGGAVNFNAGVYGVGISAVGMLSTLGITLATDAYGPVADNAGGIAQMSKQESLVRERTDALDSLGNTTAATGKGFAIGSAALTALALISAYREEVRLIIERLVVEGKLAVGYTLDLALTNPKVIVGLFIGAMLPAFFCALTMQAVGRTAQKIVMEVRRQFKEIKGLLEGTGKADYATSVQICTQGAQKEMIVPSLTAIITPIVVGLVFGVEAVVGLLAGALACGFVIAILMANSGGAWDNAKKYIEGGQYGGKGSFAHKAAVVGDTVGDPFKDTAGPSLNILIKLMSMVSVVFASFILQNTFMK